MWISDARVAENGDPIYFSRDNMGFSGLTRDHYVDAVPRIKGCAGSRGGAARPILERVGTGCIP